MAEFMFFGGNDGSNNVDSTYEYNPGSDTWDTKANIDGGARSATAAAVYDNKAYVFGGNGPSDKVEEYDPSNDSWSNKQIYQQKELEHLQSL